MITRKFGITAAAGLLLVGSGAYFMYSLFAAQGQGDLAQAPLNTVSSATPAFIMAVDDSNSMTFERIFVGGDGRMQWNGSSFFKSAGVFYNVGTGCSSNSADCYLYLFRTTVSTLPTAAGGRSRRWMRLASRVRPPTTPVTSIRP